MQTRLHVCTLFIVCVCVWLCFGGGGGNRECVCVSDLLERAGAYLLTAAVLAAFSSACCYKSFHLTFHADQKSGQAGEETDATGGNQSQQRFLGSSDD